jgi:hypothetical protein
MRWRFVLVGASHAQRLSDLMQKLNMQSTTLGTSSWFATKKNCAKLAGDLEELLESLDPDDEKTTVVIFNLLDKAYFQARGEDGNYIPHRQHDGKYHVDGDLVTIPGEQVKYLFELMLPIFKAASGLKRMLVTPIPRYLYLGCCSDPDQAPNRAEESFTFTLRSLAFKHGMKDMRAINQGKVVADQLWDKVPVHPTPEGYRVLMDYIMEGLRETSSQSTPAA